MQLCTPYGGREREREGGREGGREGREKREEGGREERRDKYEYLSDILAKCITYSGMTSICVLTNFSIGSTSLRLGNETQLSCEFRNGNETTHLLGFRLYSSLHG